MADDSRRGDLNMADADVKPDGSNSAENCLGTKMSDVRECQVAVSEVENTCQESSKDILVEETGIKSEIKDSPNMESKDAEETIKQLASLREELNKAREASARAKEEVEKAMKDLADAKQDTAKMQEQKEEETETNLPIAEKISESIPLSFADQSKPQPESPKDNQTTGKEVSGTNSNQSADEKQFSEKVTTVNVELVDESSSLQTEKEETLRTTTEENGHEETHVSDHEVEDEEEAGSEELEDEAEEGEEEEIEDDEGEQAAAKPLDDDEDRRNPQYIPKRGGFYEHDDRTREEGEELIPEQPAEQEKPKKNMRSEVVERWGHDMYDEMQQGPKSDHELVATYGYDIRQEEGAPRARRRRRYGRGPNKYDRTWEDEEAYSRPRGRGTGRGGPSRGSDSRRERPQRQETPRKEDFPPLSDQRRESKPSSESAPGPERSERETGSVERRTGSSKPSAISFRRGGGGRTFEERGKPRPVKPRGDTDDKEVSSHQELDPIDSASKDLRSIRGRSDSSRGGFASRGSRGGGTRGAGTSPRGRGSASFRGGRQGTASGNWKDDEEPQQTRSAAHQHGSGRTFHGQQAHADNYRSIDESRGRGQGKFNRQSDDQAIVGGVEQMKIDSQPARHQDAGRSKRYSSQRQRMTTPPPAAVASAPMTQPPYSVGSGNPNYYAPYNDSPPPNFVQAATGPMLPMAVAAQSAPPAYMGPPMYPTGPGPAPFASTPYQGYPAAAGPPPVQVGVPIGSPTQDNMYGGGIMYYDPGRQPIRHAAQPLRRAKAAIPIVAPDGEMDSYMVTGRPSHHE